jgi:hypothetical protein
MTKVASTSSDGIIQIDDADNHLSCFDFQKKSMKAVPPSR